MKRHPAIIVAATLLLVLLATYVGAYFAMGEYRRTVLFDEQIGQRSYKTLWQMNVFKPLAKIESAITGQKVRTNYQPLALQSVQTR